MPRGRKKKVLNSEFVEEKANEIRETFSEPKKKVAKHTKITMIRNYKVSYKSGYLLKANTYKISDIEGGMETAEKLVNAKWAKWADKKEKASTIQAPVVRPQVEEDEKIDRAEAIKKLRKQAKDRRL